MMLRQAMVNRSRISRIAPTMAHTLIAKVRRFLDPRTVRRRRREQPLSVETGRTASARVAEGLAHATVEWLGGFESNRGEHRDHKNNLLMNVGIHQSVAYGVSALLMIYCARAGIRLCTVRGFA
jgi:hypothetical protein